jgi:hypothetical protein
MHLVKVSQLYMGAHINSERRIKMFSLDGALPFVEGESEIDRVKRSVKAYLQNYFKWPESLDEGQTFPPLLEESIVAYYSDGNEPHRSYEPEIVKAAISQLELEGILARDGKHLRRGGNWKDISEQ